MFLLSGMSIVRDKWILSSALQKLVRRGLTDAAVDVAQQLEVVSPGYFRRRFPVIAYEEVGLADGEACLEAVMLCRRADRWSGLDSPIAEAVRVLSRAVKSRAACDAACLLESDPDIQISLARQAGTSDSELLGVAASRAQPWGNRAAALARLLIRRTRGCAVQPSAIDAVVEVFALPMSAKVLLGLGTSADPGMAAMLPLAYEAIQSPSGFVDEVGLPGSSDLVNGVPLCSVDMHSRTGRQALARFVRESPEVRRLQREWRGPPGLLRAVSFAVFHVDSSALSRHVVAAGAIELREKIETLELALQGLTGEKRGALYGAIKADAKLLAAVRTAALEALQCQ